MKASTEARQLKQMDLLRMEGVALTSRVGRALREMATLDAAITERVYSELPLDLRADFLRAVNIRNRKRDEAVQALLKSGREFRKERLS